MNRPTRFLCAGLTVMLLPAVAHAEVSVQLDRLGGIRRVIYMTRGTGRSTVVWGQVRARIAPETMLNPLGDNLGDLPPSIARHPATGMPWVVWARNEGNQKRLVVSAWDGKAWTTPVQVARPDPMGYDQIEPSLLFDAAGVPYLVFTEAGRPGRVLFTTLARGAWTPALALSDGSVDSRHPVVVLEGTNLKVSYVTPAGTILRELGTTILLDSATNLMDSPIPPGAAPSPGAPGDEPEEPVFIKR